MKQSKCLVFHKNVDESCVYKKVSGSVIVFLVLYVYAILLIGNDVFYPEICQDLAEYKRFSMKDFGEAIYIFGDI